MNRRVIVRSHEYYDSVRLMQVSELARREPGVREAILMMATDNNKKLLAAAGLLTAAAAAAAADDLVVGIVADDEAAAAHALAMACELLTRRAAGAAEYAHRTFESAAAALPGANVAVISVPGQYAAAEARRALERGLHTLLFSDNVSLVEEIELKQLARSKNLLLMGPDCGTALLGGIGLGFANAVRRGAVGIVGASGTGIQEIAVLLDRCGLGVSQAIGTGGRDLRAEVGGITMLMGIDLLAADAATEVIVLTSKPPNAVVAQRILERAAACAKPVVVNFLGGDIDAVSAAGLIPAQTLEDAVLQAARLLDEQSSAALDMAPAVTEQVAICTRGQRYLRGLFSGGTLCYEAMLILGETLGPIYSNIALDEQYQLQDLWHSRGHALIDLGDDAYTQGRAHPMIDPALRLQRLLHEAQDVEVAVILFDVVLGFGAHADPAAGLAETVRAARELAARGGRHLSFIASVCGTEQDPQVRSQQERVLREAGVLLATSNAQASRMAAALIQAIEVNS